MAIPAFERLHHDFRVVGGDPLDVDDARFQKSTGLHVGPSIQFCCAGAGCNALPSVTARFKRYFEYSSTTRLSLIVDGSSERAGNALSLPFISFTSTSIHSGKPRDSAAVRAPFTRSCSLAVAVTFTLVPARTWEGGMLTRLPFTSTPLWRTICPASVR